MTILKSKNLPDNFARYKTGTMSICTVFHFEGIKWLYRITETQKCTMRLLSSPGHYSEYCVKTTGLLVTAGYGT